MMPSLYSDYAFLLSRCRRSPTRCNTGLSSPCRCCLPGLVTSLNPCIYPMIPITGERSPRERRGTHAPPHVG